MSTFYTDIEELRSRFGQLVRALSSFFPEVEVDFPPVTEPCWRYSTLFLMKVLENMPDMLAISKPVSLLIAGGPTIVLELSPDEEGRKYWVEFFCQNPRTPINEYDIYIGYEIYKEDEEYPGSLFHANRIESWSISLADNPERVLGGYEYLAESEYPSDSLTKKEQEVILKRILLPVLEESVRELGLLK